MGGIVGAPSEMTSCKALSVLPSRTNASPSLPLGTKKRPPVSGEVNLQLPNDKPVTIP